MPLISALYPIDHSLETESVSSKSHTIIHSDLILLTFTSLFSSDRGQFQWLVDTGPVIGPSPKKWSRQVVMVTTN